MLIDASVARSFAVLGWVDELAQGIGGSAYVAHGVIGAHRGEPSELLGIRNALQREAAVSRPGSGRASKALAAVQGLDRLLRAGSPTVVVLIPEPDEIQMAVRLSSREPQHRGWRCELGLRARRLDAGEAVSIAIACNRSLPFASDDEQALLAFSALARTSPCRTRDLLKLLVDKGLLDERDASEGYSFLQADELHLLGGPSWHVDAGTGTGR
jgi:hypothetical protein